MNTSEEMKAATTDRTRKYSNGYLLAHDKESTERALNETDKALQACMEITNDPRDFIRSTLLKRVIHHWLDKQEKQVERVKINELYNFIRTKKGVTNGKHNTESGFRHVKLTELGQTLLNEISKLPYSPPLTTFPLTDGRKARWLKCDENIEVLDDGNDTEPTTSDEETMEEAVEVTMEVKGEEPTPESKKRKEPEPTLPPPVKELTGYDLVKFHLEKNSKDIELIKEVIQAAQTKNVDRIRSEITAKYEARFKEQEEKIRIKDEEVNKTKRMLKAYTDTSELLKKRFAEVTVKEKNVTEKEIRLAKWEQTLEQTKNFISTLFQNKPNA